MSVHLNRKYKISKAIKIQKNKLILVKILAMIEINNYFQGPIKSLKKIKPQLMQNTNDNVMSAHLLLI